MNIRWNIFLSIIVVALLGWFYWLRPEAEGLATLVKSEDSPEYIGKQVQTIVYAPTGEKQYLATATEAQYYAASGQSHFINPLMYLFDIEDKSGEQVAWQMSADKAKLTKDQMLYLEGNVMINSRLSTSRLQAVETESAVVNLKTQDVYSDASVKIRGLHFTSTGLKLTGNLQQQVATLKEQVRTHYEISSK